MPTLKDRPTIDDIKRHNSTLDYFNRMLGAPAPSQQKRTYSVFHCPQHGGESFKVSDNGLYHCKGCGIGGSIVDAVMMMEGLSLADALEALARNVPGYSGNDQKLPDRKPLKPLQQAPKVTPKPLSLALVKQQAEHLPEALPYFNQRAISTPTAYHKLLGKKTDFFSRYEMKSGEKFDFHSPRYAIPNIFGTESEAPSVRAINYRRDDVWCKDALYRIDTSILVKINDDYKQRRGHWPTEEKLIELIYGEKYRQETGSNRGAIFNADLLAVRKEAVIEYRRWEWMIVVAEGKEIDTLAIMDAGWPSIAIPDNNDLYATLPKILSNIDLIFIAGDNDAAGHKKAGDLQQAIGRGTIMIPKDYKDSNEVIVAGGADRWFTDVWKLEPILR